MADFKQCDFFLLRYVPDVMKGEFVDLGVALLEEGDGGFTGVRLPATGAGAVADPESTWNCWSPMKPNCDVCYDSASRRSLIIAARCRAANGCWRRCSNRSPARWNAAMNPVLTESPTAELGKLAQAYLESTAHGRRAATGRRIIYNAMRDAFEKVGVWQSPAMRKDIAVAQYTRQGDPLKIDCGYRPNGMVHLFHAVSLATNVDSAKMLAYSYSDHA